MKGLVIGDGNSLKKTFNVYAAPEDLSVVVSQGLLKLKKEQRHIFTYDDAAKHVASLKNWHGYDGTDYPTDKEFYAALKDGSYNGGWIIPTIDILCGKDLNEKPTTSDNLFAHKDKGAFKGTFKTTASSGGSACPGWYWSSTEYRDIPSIVWDVRLSDGYGGWDHKDSNRLSCRPVRLVEAPAL